MPYLYNFAIAGQPSDRLQYTNLTVMSNAECAARMGTDAITSAVLCIKGVNNKTTCNVYKAIVQLYDIWFKI
jgi:hypothetical protein